MKSIVLFATLLGLLATCLAATSSGDYSDPDHPGKCVFRPDLILDPGTHQDPDGCARIECSQSGHVSYATCGVQGAGPGCELGAYLDPTGDYPACCERVTICQ